MLTSEGKRKLAAGGVFGLPMALVWLTSRMVGGPSSAEADEIPLALANLAPVDPVGVVAPNAAEAAAAEHVAKLANESFGPTPFHHHRQGETPVLVVGDPEEDPAPDFSVKLIMASSTGDRALIDGKSYRVGEELADTGWIIVDIDANSRSVSIRDPETSRVRTGTVNGPKID